MIIYPQDKILIHLCMRKTNANLFYKIRYNLNLRKQYIRKNLREIQWEQCLCHIGTQIYELLFLLPLWHLLFTSIHFATQVKQCEIELSCQSYSCSCGCKFPCCPYAHKFKIFSSGRVNRTFSI